MIKIVNKEEFQKRVLDGSGLQIVRFCAEWSGPCQIMAPIYEEMVQLFKKTALFYKVDVDDSLLLMKEFGIRELPTFLFYRQGILVDFITGMVSRDLLISKLDKLTKID